VAEHRIRLRGGWGCCAAGLPATAEERVTLPIYWKLDGAGRVRLTRRFGRPPFDHDRQILVLQLDQVAGIHSLLLNGQAVAGVSPEKRRYEIELDDSRDRNLLVLELEPPVPSSEEAGTHPEWGHVALVVRPIPPATLEQCSSS
jgi:hypothetical protein